MQSLELKFPKNQTSAVIFAECENSPEQFIFALQKKFKNSPVEQFFVVCLYNFPQFWTENSQILEIVYFLQKKQDNFVIDMFSILSTKELYTQKSGLNYKVCNKTITVNFDLDFYLKIKNEFSRQEFIYNLNTPLFMQPVFIPKPWGQEIWYTGVEKRGVSKILSAHSNFSIPQPWFFAALPKTLLGEKYGHKNLVLVKILDPLPQEVTGDLYYELHQEKNEVYVVTHISANVGRIKMGISKSKLEQYKNNSLQLKKDFLEAIEQYEIVRRKIDTLRDKANEISKELCERESFLRKSMDEFAGYLNLHIGDVVSVPVLVPHALQHGVRVVEFQTPTYERLIISFAQKVLTQRHWDTKLALQLMKIQPPQKTELICLFTNESYFIELICTFQDFYAVRVTLKSMQEYQFKNIPYYQILFLVKGRGSLRMNKESHSVEAGGCIFIPAQSLATIISQEEMSFLICAPEEF